MTDLPYDIIMEEMNSIVIITDATEPEDPERANIVFVNKCFTELMGYSKEEILGQTITCLNGPQTDTETLKKLYDAQLNGEPIQVELLRYTKKGKEIWLNVACSPIYNKQGKLCYFVSTEYELAPQDNPSVEPSFIDPLTQLYNRTLFYKRAPEIMHAMQRYQEPFGLLILDIDHFKELNAIEGHVAGDDALCEVAKSCQQIFRRSDLICRYGGDKFAIIVERNQNTESLFKKAKQLDTQIKLSTDNKLSVNIGGTISKLFEDSMEDVMKRAEQALYESKRKKGKTSLHIH